VASANIYGVVAGGLSPVFLTSVSVVIVVVPPGVSISISFVVDDFFVSVHPAKLNGNRQATKAAAIRCFIFNGFRKCKLAARYDRFDKKPAWNRNR
jgi:hypothetical protein